ncbi:MAG: hypothetical protein ACOY4P_18590, partial [Pseudomonadota bacterium]
ADKVNRVPPAGIGRGGMTIAVRRAVAVDLETQQRLYMADIGMICQKGMAKPDLAELIAIGRTSLNREAEKAGGQIPRRGQSETVGHVQRAIYVENDKIGGKSLRDEQFAKGIAMNIGVMVFHGLNAQSR